MEELQNKNRKFTLKKMMIHLKTILVHKHYVFCYMLDCGMPLRGLLHDLSKFSPAEFIQNVKYTEKGVSPVSIQMKELGVSTSWMHHKGCNPHHYVYWMDKFDDGCYVHRMPFKYMVECLCDYLAANRAYGGKEASFTNEYHWWRKYRYIQNMHPDNIEFLDYVFRMLSELETREGHFAICPDSTGKVYYFIEDILNLDFLKNLYEGIVKKSTNPECVKIKQPGKI